MLSKLIPKTSKYYYRTVIGMLFILVGFVVSIISVFVNGYYQFNAMHKEFNISAKNAMVHKQNFLYAETDNFKNYLRAIDNTPEFKTFIQTNPKDDTHSKQHVADIMLAVTHSNPNIMQFRFIGTLGCEAIRIDRESIGSSPFIVDKYFLQNKLNRYYFKETQKISEGQVWFSKIDLNMEHGEIVKPIVPTLRMAKPYYFNGKFKGILIINIFMKDILNELMKSELFNIAIIDKNGHILTNNFQDYNEDKKEWTRYIKDAKDTRYTEDQNKDSFLIKLFFIKKRSSLNLSKIIRNEEGLKLVIEEKTKKFIEYAKDITDYMLIMGIIVFLISFPISIILSSYPLKLHNKLKNSKNDLKEQLNIIDKYIYMSRTDINGKITDISTAFTKLSGYSKDELIGMNHSMLRADDTPALLYKEMWNSILAGKNWTGVIKNIGKNGKIYWTKNHISPIIKNNKITGFTSIREDITNQKHIEEISTKDELTQAYNRRFFNQIFPTELKHAKRKGDILCVAMFDIDHFKKYNDTYGHIKGDKVLQQVVKQVSNKLQRAGDYLFRIGGEEFIVIYSKTKGYDEAKKFSLELVKAIEDLSIEHKKSETTNVLTISLGLLCVTSNCNKDEGTILEKVDELLYYAKNAGRNRLAAEEC